MAEFTFRERKTSGQHLDKKVDRIIQGLLNEMTITVDNTHEEDVTLPEMIDRIYTRLLSVENKLKETGNDEIDSLLNSGNVKFYASLVQFPKPDSEDAKEDVLYIDKSSGAVFTDTTYSVMTAASSSANGSSGLVPTPTSGKESSFLRGDGTWNLPTKLDEIAIASNGDLNTITTTGEYYGVGGNSITNKPSNVDYFHLSVIRTGTNVYFQRLYSNTAIYIRIYTVTTSAWTDWVQDKNESNTINNFLYRDKGKERTDGTTHTYQEVLWGTDYNDLTTTGLYVVRANTSFPLTNSPDGNNTNSLFYVLVTAYSSKYVKQIAMSVRDTAVIYVRTLLNGTWKSWSQISGTSSISSTSGTFTPVLTPENSSDNISFSSVTGEYHIIDNCVYISIYGTINNNTSGNFSGTITGLPFTCSGSTYHALHISLNNVNTITESDFLGIKSHVLGGYNYINLQTITKAAVSSTNESIPLKTGDIIRINGIYPI